MKHLPTLLLAITSLSFGSFASAQTFHPADQRPAEPAATLLFSAEQSSAAPDLARIGFIDFQRLALESAAGKAATQQLKALQNVKFADIERKNQALVALQRTQSTSSGLTPTAAANLQRDIDRAQLEIRRAQQLAQEELDSLNQKLMIEFSAKVKPIVEQVRGEQGLWAVFAVNDAIASIMPGRDLSAEIIKRLDAQKSPISL